MSIYYADNRHSNVEAYYGAQIREFHMGLHSHPRCEIMYVVDGECWVEARERREKLGQKNFVFLDQLVPHSLNVDSGSPCTLLNLEFSCSPEEFGLDLGKLQEKSVSFRTFLKKEAPVLFLYVGGNVCGALRDLLEALQNPGNHDSCLTELLLARLLLELSSCAGRERESSVGAKYVNQAKEYLLRHFDRDICVKEVAESVGLNQAYLQTLFSTHFGCGVMAYANRLRIEKACFLLKNSELSITDIACETGYNSRQQFGYSFHRQMGKSPQQYRKELGYQFQEGIHQQYYPMGN